MPERQRDFYKNTCDCIKVDNRNPAVCFIRSVLRIKLGLCVIIVVIDNDNYRREVVSSNDNFYTLVKLIVLRMQEGGLDREFAIVYITNVDNLIISTLVKLINL